MTARSTAIRSALAVAVLIPAATLTSMLGQPFAISAIAGTAAIVLHAPKRYRERPQPILACYAAGIPISAPISLEGVVIGLPFLSPPPLAPLITLPTPPP